MKKKTHKNQVVITALALMIAVAGYLNFSGKEITLLDGNDQLEQASASASATMNSDANASGDSLEQSEVSGEAKDTKETGSGEVDASNSDVADSDMLSNGDDSLVSAAVDDEVDETVAASNTKVADSILKAQLSKEQSRSQNKEMLMDIINSENVTKAQKKDATNQLLQLSDFMEKEASAEQVLEAKGYQDCMVSMSKDSVDVMVSLKDITDVDRAKIEDVVQRKTGVSLNNIVISSFK